MFRYFHYFSEYGLKFDKKLNKVYLGAVSEQLQV